MNSVDTNVVLYALDKTSPDHHRARSVLQRLVSEPGQWLLCDQMLFELYRALRNPKVVRRPLTARAAAGQLSFLRERTGALHVAYERRLWPEVLALLSQHDRRKGILVFDVVLAVTLKANGVKRFYTHNVKDFQTLGLFEAVDPLV